MTNQAQITLYEIPKIFNEDMDEGDEGGEEELEEYEEGAEEAAGGEGANDGGAPDQMIVDPTAQPGLATLIEEPEDP